MRHTYVDKLKYVLLVVRCFELDESMLIDDEEVVILEDTSIVQVS